MNIETVCIIGGAGFVGRSIADQACAAGHRVRIVTRSRPRARNLTVLPTLEVLVTDVNTDAGLARALTHSRALRFARVKVAEIQLYQASQVKSGRAARDLYGTLGPHIDLARKAFRDRFLIPLNGVPDYLHQELVKTLANEDAVLLGPSYPGPLA